MGKREINRSLIYKLIIAFFIVLIIGAIISFIMYAEKGNSINITSEYLEITGIRGQKIEYKNIEAIEIKGAIPVIERRLNGSEIGSSKRGTFKVEGLGECVLFINTDIKSFIYVKTNGNYTIINSQDENATKNTYDELNLKWEGSKK